jgi:hypothetical protein
MNALRVKSRTAEGRREILQHPTTFLDELVADPSSGDAVAVLANLFMEDQEAAPLLRLVSADYPDLLPQLVEGLEEAAATSGARFLALSVLVNNIWAQSPNHRNALRELQAPNVLARLVLHDKLSGLVLRGLIRMVSHFCLHYFIFS